MPEIMNHHITDIALLFLASLTAGLVDAVAGGGGLIQLPALLLLFPQLTAVTAIATNKFSSAIGTLFATYRYRKHLVGYNKQKWTVIILLAFLGSLIGSYFAGAISEVVFRPLVCSIILLVAAYTYFNKSFGLGESHRPTSQKSKWMAPIFIGAIGFYDGLFGPGTGGFFIFTLVSFLGFSFLRASAWAKVLNLATNIAALVYFGPALKIHYQLAVPMAVFNLVGNYFGTFLANKHGAALVRKLFLTVSAALVVNLGLKVILGYF